MRQRIKTHHCAEKIFNTAASPLEAEALAYRRYLDSTKRLQKTYCITMFGKEMHVSHEEAEMLRKDGFNVYTK